jgi:CDP-paratose 2-epimerase
LTGRPLDTGLGDWRAGDQLYFVADTRKLSDRLGWQARVRWKSGLQHLADWLREHRFGGATSVMERRRVTA